MGARAVYSLVGEELPLPPALVAAEHQTFKTRVNFFNFSDLGFRPKAVEIDSSAWDWLRLLRALRSPPAYRKSLRGGRQIDDLFILQPGHQAGDFLS